MGKGENCWVGLNKNVKILMIWNMSQIQSLVSHPTTLSDKLSLSFWGHGPARTFGFAFLFLFIHFQSHTCIWSLKLFRLDSGMCLWFLLLSDGRKLLADCAMCSHVNSQKKNLSCLIHAKFKSEKKNLWFSTHIPHSKNSVLTKAHNIRVKVKCLLK